jgi:UDP-glucuronate decarboxylase
MQALRGEPITIYGEGSQTRSFCYVDDLVDGIMRLMASDDTLLGPVNLGNPNEMSVRELAEQVVKMTGSRSRLIFKPLPVDDPRQRQPDITLARHKLNWTPKVQLGDGLDRTVAYFRSVATGKMVSAGGKSKTTTVKKSPPIQSEANVL